MVPVEILSEGGKVIGAELTAPAAAATHHRGERAEVAACLSLSLMT